MPFAQTPTTTATKMTTGWASSCPLTETVPPRATEQASNACYADLTSDPTTPSTQPHSMALAQQTVPATGRAGPLYQPAVRDFLDGRRCLGEWGTLLVYFLVPRVPEVSYNNEKTFEGDSTTRLSFEALEPAWFAFSARINLAMATKTSSFCPHTNTINVVVKDLLSAGSPIKVSR
ncbi:hypothetical protein PtB15_8B191 [Puccinia triticina]|nr:hypothetical protein PtB15_8B191 [Puccinia triticina]